MVEATSNLTIVARQIIIEGALVGNLLHGTVNGCGITLRASEAIFVTGHVSAGHGATPDFGEPGPGGNAGALTLVCPVVLLDGPETLVGANGGAGSWGGYTCGRGGDALVYGSVCLPDHSKPASVIAGRGGRGGHGIAGIKAGAGGTGGDGGDAGFTGLGWRPL